MQNPLDTLGDIAKSDDRRAVSPVIGVILMVAITVILAAVIATFVLGLGEQINDTTPNANFNADFAGVNESGGSFVTIQHRSGDEIDTANLRLGGDLNYNLTIADVEGETFGVGEQFTISANNNASSADINVDSASEGDEIQIIYESGDGSGTILRIFELPQDYDNT